MLARLDGTQADLCMRRRDRQVQHDLDGGIREQRLDGARIQAELGGACLRAREVEGRSAQATIRYSGNTRAARR